MLSMLLVKTLSLLWMYLVEVCTLKDPSLGSSCLSSLMMSRIWLDCFTNSLIFTSLKLTFGLFRVLERTRRDLLKLCEEL